MRTLWVICVGMLLAGSGTCEAADQPSSKRGVTADGALKAAVAVRVVNPTRPAVTIGHRVMRKFTNVYADIRVQVFVIQDANKNTIVWQGCDFALVRAPVVDRIKKQIQQKYGIPPQAVCINTSHTHSAPPLTPMEAVLPEHFDQEYADFVVRQAVAVVGDAVARLQPARVRYLADSCQVGINRRLGPPGSVNMLPNPQGVVDQRVQVVAAYSQETDKLIGAAVKYACHPVTVQNLGLGSDYPGYMRKIFEKRHPGAAAVFLQGCGADVRIRVVNKDMTGWVEGTLKAAERFGRELADAVDRALAKPGVAIHGPVTSNAREIRLPVKVLRAADYQAAAKRNDAFSGAWGKIYSKMIKEGKKIPNTVPYRLQSFRFGGKDPVLTVVALDGEIFTEYGLNIERRLGHDNVIALGYSNAVISYVPTKRALLAGGYETTAFRFYRIPGPFDPKIEAMIIDAAVELASGKNVVAKPRKSQRNAEANPVNDPETNNEEQEQEEEELLKLEEMKLPTAVELLRDPPVDWIILKNDDVIVCKPIYPRPNTLAKMQEKIDASRKWPRPATKEEAEERKQRRAELFYLSIILPGTEDAIEYQLHMKHVQEIRYHEDLMQRRMLQLINDGKQDQAYDMFFRLKRREPDWPGLADVHNRLLFNRAAIDLKKNQPQRALVFLEEIHGRQPDYPGLKTQLGTVVDLLIAQAVDREDFRRARYFLRWLTKKVPEHSIAAKWRDELVALSAKLLDEARAQSNNGKHDLAAVTVDKAALVWPRASGLPEAHRRISRRFQRLKVGVLHLPGETTAYPLPTPAGRRYEFLSRSLLFEIDRIDETAHYRSGFFEQWEPTDLGRQAEFSLRQSRSYWESQPIVTAPSVVSFLAARLDPASSLYDERFDHYVESLTVLTPFRFQVRFTHVPLRTEALFHVPVTRPQAPALSVATGNLTAVPGGDAIVSRRFRIHSQDEQRSVYRRVVPEPEGVEYHVAEVVEKKYASHDEAVRGLLRGEVSMLPHLHSRDVDRLRKDGRFFVRRHALPITHVLQFNRQSPIAKSRELRRAMAYALDRNRLLNDVVLRDPDSDLARLVSAPFPSKGYAYGVQVPLRRYDLVLAFSLALAAKKQFGGTTPKLKMVCAPDPIAEEAARDMVKQWKRIGIDVELASGTVGPSSNWDIIYRTQKMAEPLADLWPFLTLQPQARVESLRHLPDWLSQELIELEGAGNWDSARRMLHQLHQHLWAEVQFIPLWEIDDFMVIRKRISGVPRRPIHPYQDVERWIVQSWYPQALP